jgi:hypothetical protein
MAFSRFLIYPYVFPDFLKNDPLMKRPAVLRGLIPLMTLKLDVAEASKEAGMTLREQDDLWGGGHDCLTGPARTAKMPFVAMRFVRHADLRPAASTSTRKSSGCGQRRPRDCAKFCVSRKYHGQLGRVSSRAGSPCHRNSHSPATALPAQSRNLCEGPAKRSCERFLQAAEFAKRCVIRWLFFAILP